MGGDKPPPIMRNKVSVFLDVQVFRASEKIKHTVLLVLLPELCVVPADEYVKYASAGTP